MALEGLVLGDRANAALGWTMVAVVVLGAAASAATGALLWGGLSLSVAAVASVPAASTRDPTAMVPWPLVAVAAAAVTVRAAGLRPEVAGYFVVATLAVLVVVELDAFTPVELGRRFAVAFAVLTTMAVEALWIVAQYASDRWLGTRLLGSQAELQRDIVAVTAVGFVVGGLFYWVVARFEPAGTARGPSEEGAR